MAGMGRSRNRYNDWTRTNWRSEAFLAFELDRADAVHFNNGCDIAVGSIARSAEDEFRRVSGGRVDAGIASAKRAATVESMRFDQPSQRDNFEL